MTLSQWQTITRYADLAGTKPVAQSDYTHQLQVAGQRHRRRQLRPDASASRRRLHLMRTATASCPITSPAANNLVLTDGSYDYEYDPEGNRTRRRHTATDEVTDYHWDHRNRLVKVIHRDAGGDPIKSVDQILADEQVDSLTAPGDILWQLTDRPHHRPPLRHHRPRMDEDAGLYYYRARWYDPELGRFLSEDLDLRAASVSAP